MINNGASIMRKKIVIRIRTRGQRRVRNSWTSSGRRVNIGITRYCRRISRSQSREMKGKGVKWN